MTRREYTHESPASEFASAFYAHSFALRACIVTQSLMSNPIAHPEMNKSDNAKRYWRSNLTLVSILLGVWAVAVFGLSIFFIEPANQIKIGSLGFGFWMAQQGSIFVFVLLVIVYAKAMDWIDRKHHVNE